MAPFLSLRSPIQLAGCVSVIVPPAASSTPSPISASLTSGWSVFSLQTESPSSETVRSRMFVRTMNSSAGSLTAALRIAAIRMP